MGRPVKDAETLVQDMPPVPQDSGYDDNLLIVQAIANRGKKGGAALAAKLEAERGHLVSVETIRRRMRRIRSPI
ncbi:hypothetical protein Sa4125_39200 [Aureimonas sp. SA4125]|nr:hypothetical protein Sa4125_39200 [Aureimonas sp. SA4125]